MIKILSKLTKKSIFQKHQILVQLNLIYIIGTWIEIKTETYGCIWGNESFDCSEYEEYFIRGWKKVCLNDNPYLYCCDSNIKPRKVVIISKAGRLAIIITIISVIVVIFIALCSIAYYRYRY